MPPQTTQQSHRPRVSDRTMVGTLPPRCLQALPHRTKNAATDGIRRNATLQNRAAYGAGCQTPTFSISMRKGRSVFSYIPFYRTYLLHLHAEGEKCFLLHPLL